MVEIVTIGDIRRTGHCTRGVRRWFEANHLDFAEFLKVGIPADTLLATGDGLASLVVSKLRETPNG